MTFKISPESMEIGKSYPVYADDDVVWVAVKVANGDIVFHKYLFEDE